jgi:hypothetical protein
VVSFADSDEHKYMDEFKSIIFKQGGKTVEVVFEFPVQLNSEVTDNAHEYNNEYEDDSDVLQ